MIPPKSPQMANPMLNPQIPKIDEHDELQGVVVKSIDHPPIQSPSDDVMKTE